MKSKIISFSFLLLFLLLPLSLLANPRPVFSKKKIQVGSKVITVEVAKTAEETAYGLMFKRQLSENDGMLFIFSQPQILSFWMKNTFVDLSIAYFDAHNTLLEIIDMKAAQSELQTHFDSYPSSKPAKYALEMNRGWFKKNNIKTGDKLKLTVSK